MKEKKKVAKKTKKTQPEVTPLSGNLHSGLIFIGDAYYFSGPSEFEYDPKLGQVDVTPEKPDNPLYNFNKIAQMAESDVNLDFPFGKGRGVIVNTNTLSGKYSVSKEENEEGNTVITIVVKK